MTDLLRHGEAHLAIGHRVRLVAFGSVATQERGARCRVVTHGQIVARHARPR